MGKAGRSRKSGARHECGKLVQKPAEGVPGSVWQRIKAAAIKFAIDPKCGTEIGRLAIMAGELSHAQVSAAFRIHDVYKRYHRLKALRDTPKSPSYEQGFGGSADLAEERMSAEQLEAFEGAIRKATADWKRIDDELAELPRNLRQAVLDICVFDTPTNPMLYPALRQFLDHMAKRWSEKGRVPAGRPGRSAARRPLGEPKKAAPARPDANLVTLDQVVRKLRPDLDEEKIQAVAESFRDLREHNAAVKDREAFRREKLRDR